MKKHGYSVKRERARDYEGCDSLSPYKIMWAYSQDNPSKVIFRHGFKSLRMLQRALGFSSRKSSLKIHFIALTYFRYRRISGVVTQRCGQPVKYD